MDLADTPSAIRAFIDATNAGDTDAFVAAFSTDATLDDWGRSYRGHPAIRQWDGTDNIGVHSRFELLSVDARDEPDTYVAVIRVRGEGYNGTGPMVFRLRGNLIRRLEIAG